MESIRLEKLKARKSEMNQDRRIWKTYKDHWIKAVGQQTTSARTCGRPHLEGYMVDHVSEYTWHN
jgi:hypothetical protein